MLDLPRAGPLVVVLRTTKGRGVSFMEGLMEWHYLPMTEAQYQQALLEVAEQ
jgi:transketolase